MWVTKLLISPVKIKIFCPKKSKFGLKMAFLFILGQALPAHLVGGCGARAVSRKTPIYFMFQNKEATAETVFADVLLEILHIWHAFLKKTWANTNTKMYYWKYCLSHTPR